MLVGAIGDPDLGPVLAVGFGGRRAGLGRTAAFRLLPVTDAETDELIDSAEGVVSELDGFRGSAVLDREALRELMLRFALLLRELPEVVEFYRMAGQVDYLLRVVVPDIEAYDNFYKRLIAKIDISDVSTTFAMEQIKYTTALPLTYVVVDKEKARAAE